MCCPRPANFLITLTMSELSFKTTKMRSWLDRLQAGDPSARDELLRACFNRLERLANIQLKDFPNVRRWTEVGDVLNGALVRLLRTLERDFKPTSTREFFAMAAACIRTELLDLARHYSRQRRQGQVNIQTLQPGEDSSFSNDPEDSNQNVKELERWSRFHETIEKLPAEEREVFSLAFYQGWTQAQIAELHQVNERTIRRRWASACLKLVELLQDDLPRI